VEDAGELGVDVVGIGIGWFARRRKARPV